MPIFLRVSELKKQEAMRKKTATTGSARSSKYMMLKLLRKEEEIYKEDKLEGRAVTWSENDRLMPLKDLNSAKGDRTMLKKS